MEFRYTIYYNKEVLKVLKGLNVRRRVIKVCEAQKIIYVLYVDDRAQTTIRNS